MAYLVLVRHGQSEWNAQGLWTGWRDVPLSPEGIAEARRAGELLRDIPFDIAYTSALTRAQQTLEEIKRVLGREDLPTVTDPALNERDYGDLTGKNKWKILEEYGEEQFLKWRRSWDYPVPGGETLKDVYARVVPYYQREILPQLREGRNVLIAAHGNSLRALVKYLENIPDDEIPKLEIGTGEVYVYQVDPEGRIVSKEIRAVNPNRGRQ
ncbi:MAG TPA: 2,3-diphosphoglycerate-dependent phosphoglycerate mutase [Chloroflexota bacterium]|jgi:2,3-bisphosphoglycerate-dependent phosphoglycerate mutase|nr:2,3-diphosphoglycerate-dependent phosphoglycerate mutase [Chloroflexota bacterium]